MWKIEKYRSDEHRGCFQKIGIYLSVIMIVSSLSGCGSRKEIIPALIEPVKVQKEMVKVEKRDIENLEVFEGAVTPEVKELSFAMDGTVANLNVVIGQPVKKGEILATLEQKELEEEIEELGQEIKTTNRDVEQKNELLEITIAMQHQIGENVSENFVTEKASIEVPDTKYIVTQVKECLNQIKTLQNSFGEKDNFYKQQISTWQENLDKLNSVSVNTVSGDGISGNSAVTNIADVRSMIESKIASLRGEAVYETKAIQAQILLYQDQISMLNKEIASGKVSMGEVDKTLIIKNYKEIKINEAILENSISTNCLLNEKEIGQLQTKTSKIQAELGKTYLQSPCNGEVIAAVDGDGNLLGMESSVYADEAALYVTDESQLWVYAMDMTSYDIQENNEIYGEINGKKYTLTNVPYTDAERKDASIHKLLQPLRFSISADTVDYKSGDLVNIYVVKKKKENVLAIPSSAVIYEGNSCSVIVKEGTSEKKVEIEIGTKTNLYTEVVSNLKEGDELIVNAGITSLLGEETKTAEKTTYENNISFTKSSFMYPKSESVYFEDEDGRMGTLNASVNDILKKGDVIGTVSLYSTESLLLEQEDQIKLLQSDLDMKKVEFEKEYKKQQEEYEKQIAETEKKVAQYQLTYLETEYNQFVEDTKEQIEIAQKKLAKLQAEAVDNQIIAPIGGTLETLTPYEEGHSIKKKDLLAVVEDKSYPFLMVEDLTHQLTYNATVEVKGKLDGEEVTYTGRVVKASNILAKAVYGNGIDNQAVMIQFIKKEEAKNAENLVNINIVAVDKQSKQVCVVDSAGIFEDSKGSYVYELVGEAIHKQYVVKADSTNKFTWIIQGLDPGTKVILKKTEK